MFSRFTLFVVSTFVVFIAVATTTTTVTFFSSFAQATPTITNDLIILYPSDCSEVVAPATVSTVAGEATVGFSNSTTCSASDGSFAFNISTSTHLSNDPFVYSIGLRQHTPDRLNSNSIWASFIEPSSPSYSSSSSSSLSSPSSSVEFLIRTSVSASSSSSFVHDSPVACLYFSDNSASASSSHQLRFRARESVVQVAYLNLSKVAPPRILSATTPCVNGVCDFLAAPTLVQIVLDRPSACVPVNHPSYGRILINGGLYVCDPATTLASNVVQLTPSSSSSSSSSYLATCVVPINVSSAIAARGETLSVSIDWPRLSSSSNSSLLAAQQQNLALNVTVEPRFTYASPPPSSSDSALKNEKMIMIIIVIVSVVVPVMGVLALVMYGLSHVRHEKLLKENVRDVSQAPSEPGQQVAIIFTDLQESTNLWATVPRSCSYALDVHNQIFRKHIALKNAYETKTNGDQFIIACKLLHPPRLLAAAAAASPSSSSSASSTSDHEEPSRDKTEGGIYLAQQVAELIVDVQREFMMTPFPAAIDAVYKAKTDEDFFDIDDDPTCLVDAPPGAAFHGPRVRIGVACGEIKDGELEVKWDEVAKGYDYFGPLMNLAARAESAAQGGQILLSPSCLPLMNAAKLGATVSSSGKYELKGFPQPVELFQLMPNELAARSMYFSALSDTFDELPAIDGESGGLGEHFDLSNSSDGLSAPGSPAAGAHSGTLRELGRRGSDLDKYSEKSVLDNSFRDTASTNPPAQQQQQQQQHDRYSLFSTGGSRTSAPDSNDKKSATNKRVLESDGEDEFLLGFRVMLRPIASKDKQVLLSILEAAWRLQIKKGGEKSSATAATTATGSSPVYKEKDEEKLVQTLAQRIGKVRAMLKARQARHQQTTRSSSGTAQSKDRKGSRATTASDNSSNNNNNNNNNNSHNVNSEFDLFANIGARRKANVAPVTAGGGGAGGASSSGGDGGRHSLTPTLPSEQRQQQQQHQPRTPLALPEGNREGKVNFPSAFNNYHVEEFSNLRQFAGSGALGSSTDGRGSPSRSHLFEVSGGARGMEGIAPPPHLQQTCVGDNGSEQIS